LAGNRRSKKNLSETATLCGVERLTLLDGPDTSPDRAPLLSDHDEQAVFRKLRTGDRDAWTALYDRYSEDIWRYVARLIGPDPAAVADVVQEVFLAASKGSQRFDPDRGTPWAWLAGIAHHLVTAWWRQRGRAARLHVLLESGQADLRQLLDSAEPVDDLLQRRELVDLVRFVLAELPPDYAVLLTAKYQDEQSLEELVSRQGGTIESVKSKLARARREFKTKFERLSRTGVQPVADP
jgi:RNA polymerase sigma factor (sigma-70 family)